jgi:DNA repair protein RadD
LDEINAGLLKVVGFTATPYRLDSGMLHEGKDRLFTDIAFQVPVLEMIQQGYLCPVVPKQTSTQLDVGGVGTRGGEFIAKDLEAAVDRSSSTAKAADPGWCSALAWPMSSPAGSAARWIWTACATC